jgi:hypothetical protein
MPDPQLRFDREELQLQITGLTGGWTFGQLGELKLFDYAQVQFPSSWSDYQMGVASRIVEAQWRFNAHLVLEQTLEAGVNFTARDGVGSSLSLDQDLKYHLMNRPTAQIDLMLRIHLDGSFDGRSFDGSGQITVGVGGRF